MRGRSQEVEPPEIEPASGAHSAIANVVALMVQLLADSGACQYWVNSTSNDWVE